MNKKILDNIKKAAERDNKKRRDPRYLRTMAFLTKKGALKANRDFTKWYRGKLNIKDALWAGKHLEPRVLEVLPAIALRLPKEIIMTDAPKILLNAIEALRNKNDDGPDFMGVPFDKYRAWMNLELTDRRTKPVSELKQMRSFRLSPDTIKKLEKRMRETGLSGAEVIESLMT